MIPSFLFTSESVTEGHPDKIADQVSDAILDAILEQDPNSRVACETFVTTGMVMIGGEITTSGYINYSNVAREMIKEIGYTDSSYGLDWETCAVLTSIDRQSADIAMGVDRLGAGDQGMMFGYATNETPEMMPMPITLAHRLSRGLAGARKSGEIPYLRPDGKSQVTIEYHNGKPARVDTVVIAAQHDPDVSSEKIRDDIISKIITPALPAELVDPGRIKYHINATGRFVTGGPHGDAGLTGRKIIVDTYGGFCRHGGGAYSGKDPTKVDRSGSYAARYVAKNIVAAGLAAQCEIQIAYVIGVADPVSIMVDTFGTNTIPEEDIVGLVRKHFDLTPQGIIETLDLRKPVYKRTAAYGHFGREEPGFTWERCDKADELKRG